MKVIVWDTEGQRIAYDEECARVDDEVRDAVAEVISQIGAAHAVIITQDGDANLKFHAAQPVTTPQFLWNEKYETE